MFLQPVSMRAEQEDTRAAFHPPALDTTTPMALGLHPSVSLFFSLMFLIFSVRQRQGAWKHSFAVRKLDPWGDGAALSTGLDCYDGPLGRDVVGEQLYDCDPKMQAAPVKIREKTSPMME